MPFMVLKVFLVKPIMLCFVKQEMDILEYGFQMKIKKTETKRFYFVSPFFHLIIIL